MRVESNLTVHNFTQLVRKKLGGKRGKGNEMEKEGRERELIYPAPSAARSARARTLEKVCPETIIALSVQPFYVVVFYLTHILFIWETFSQWFRICTLDGWSSKTSCARGDTICSRPSPPLWAPKRLARRRADATQQYFPTPNTFPR